MGSCIAGRCNHVLICRQWVGRVEGGLPAAWRVHWRAQHGRAWQPVHYQLSCSLFDCCAAPCNGQLVKVLCLSGISRVYCINRLAVGSFRTESVERKTTREVHMKILQFAVNISFALCFPFVATHRCLTKREVSFCSWGSSGIYSTFEHKK